MCTSPTKSEGNVNTSKVLPLRELRFKWKEKSCKCIGESVVSWSTEPLGKQKNEGRRDSWKGMKHFVWDIWGSGVLNRYPKLGEGALNRVENRCEERRAGSCLARIRANKGPVGWRCSIKTVQCLC